MIAFGNTKKLIGLIALFLGLFTVSCADVDGLSDSNNVEDFSLQFYSDNIQLGNVQITDNEVVVPVVYGKYNFPLHIQAKLKTSPGIDKVLGVDFSKELVFESITDTKIFYVVAASGLTSKWTIRLQELPRSENETIEQVAVSNISPVGILYGKTGVIDETSNMVKIWVLGNQTYPISLMTDITIPDTAHFDGYTNPSRLEFAAPSSTKTVKVIAATGKVRIWTVQTVQPIEITDLSSLSSDEMDRLSLDPASLQASFNSTFTQHYEITSTEIDNDKGIIELMAKPKSGAPASFTAAVKLDFKLSSYSQLIGIDTTQKLTFTALDQQQSFYVVDNISGKLRKWNVQLASWKNSAAFVTSFAFTYQTNTGTLEPKVQLRTEAKDILINRESHEIFLKVSSKPGVAAWAKLEITPTEIGLSPEAKLQEIVLNTAYNFSGSINDTKSFQVIAADGTSRTWTIRLKNDISSATSSSEAELRSFVVEKKTPKTLQMDLQGVVNASAQTVKLTVRGGVKGGFPLTITPRILVSDFATTPGRTYGDPLVFTDLKSTVTVKVVAEDGTTTKDWVVSLDNQEPPKATGTDVSSYTVTPSNGYGIDNSATVIDKVGGKIRLYVFALGAGQPRITHNITISEGAKLSGTTSPGVLTFMDLNDTKSFSVIAENGDTKQWTVSLVYAPQLAIGDLNLWSGNTPQGWATANNMFTTGTTPITTPWVRGAKLVTNTVDLLGIREVAAASIFLGHFEFDAGKRGTPQLMTWFGTPFIARPSGMEVDLNYQPGPQLQQVQNGSFVNINDRKDKGSVVVELLHYTGDPAKIEFHDLPSLDQGKGVTILAKVKILLDDTRSVVGNQNGWIHQKLVLDYLPGNETLPVTHLHIVFSSSHEGNFFIGAKGSTLLIDNVKLNY